MLSGSSTSSRRALYRTTLVWPTGLPFLPTEERSSPSRGATGTPILPRGRRRLECRGTNSLAFIGNRKDGLLFCSENGKPLLQRNVLRDSLHKIQKGRVPVLPRSQRAEGEAHLVPGNPGSEERHGRLSCVPPLPRDTPSLVNSSEARIVAQKAH
jgi:hypothetical protein